VQVQNVALLRGKAINLHSRALCYIPTHDSRLAFCVLRRQRYLHCELSFYRVLPNVSIYFRINSYQKPHIHIYKIIIIIIIIIISGGGGISISSSSSSSSSSCAAAAAIAAKKYTKQARFPIK
jgi:hypothetical protein